MSKTVLFEVFELRFCGSIKVTSVSDVSNSMNALSTARDNLGLVKGKRQFRASKWQRQFRGSKWQSRDNLGVANGAAI